MKRVTFWARQGSIEACFAISLLVTILSWLVSLFQFRTTLHPYLITADDLTSSTLTATRVHQTNSSHSGHEWISPPATQYPQSFNRSINDIPRTVHRMWHTTTISQAWYIWTEETAHQFIATNFPWCLSAYTNHLPPVQRIDVLRYFLLWHYGGVYLDPQLGCLQPLEPLLQLGDTPVDQALFPLHWPYGIGNEFMASTPGHPFLIELALKSLSHQGPTLPAFMIAFFNLGPAFASRTLDVWLRSADYSRSSLAILPPAVLANGGERACFTWFQGPGPHGDDIAVSLYFFGNWIGWLGAAVSLIFMGLCIFDRRAGAKVLNEKYALGREESLV
ncbi:hypothetical protein POX_e06718 [Penicillium oxalicum]|uniref:hypothetical protein n=1 Tax=Penicillium oxalicum TaxID=69781 RepID=UPI0020B863CF|nr:hypothetical protein POX_e06718 [Penicillium oxalicum]KAI2788697.1 hypothetical protein POX_e06718 [Penicillium oxalicum]